MIQVDDLGGGIRRLTLNDAERRNTLSRKMISLLTDEFRRAAEDSELRVIVLTGAGPAFCSGGAVDEMAANLADPPWQTRQRMRRSFQALMRAVWDLEVPVIAVVDGPAVGAGLDLALVCDLRIVTERARFVAGFVRLGLVAGDGGGWLLPRLIGVDRALEMLWTARSVNAQEALAMGLVTRVVTSAECDDVVMTLTRDLADRPKIAVSLTKRIVHEGLEQTFAQGLDAAANSMAVAAATADHAEAVAAYHDRRQPLFTGS